MCYVLLHSGCLVWPSYSGCFLSVHLYSTCEVFFESVWPLESELSTHLSNKHRRTFGLLVNFIGWKKIELDLAPWLAGGERYFLNGHFQGNFICLKWDSHEVIKTGKKMKIIWCCIWLDCQHVLPCHSRANKILTHSSVWLARVWAG